MEQVSKLNPFSIDHIVVNVDEKYQKIFNLLRKLIG